MERSLLHVSWILPTALAVLAIGRPSPAPRMLVAHASNASCKPSAPVRIELSPRDMVGGRARVDYVLVPVIDALDVDVSIAFPQGGSLRSHFPPARGATPRGSSLGGTVEVDLPAYLAGAELEIVAHVSILDADAPDGASVFTVTERVTWGDVERAAEGVTRVRAGDETNLDVPATRS